MAPLPKLTDDHVMKVCQPGTEKCCRYLTLSGPNWWCVKHTSLAAMLDRRVAEKTIRARGDNCEGRS